ncbi:MAG: hypothetical protein DRQ78_00135 [Epsilonproteobacteria bacterium]|nr:MAG: hypothetical protein DRQ78_00135 [Campylobacterota bacterium]
MAEFNSFTLPYSISPYIYSSSYTIAIIAHQDDEQKIGETLEFDVDYWIDPNSIPVGVTPVARVEWINHLGEVLGTEDHLIYKPDEPGWYSIQAEVIYEDEDDNFYLRLTEGYTFNILPLEGYRYGFILSYDSSYDKINYSNMDLFRFLTYMPSWSLAHKAHYSNTSKFISPQLERVSFVADNIDNIMSNNKSDIRAFGYQEHIMRILAIETPDYLRTEHGYCVNLGEISTSSLSSISIGAIKKEETYNVDKISMDIFAGEQQIRLPIPSRLYIKIKEERFSQTSDITLHGISKDGVFITERIKLQTYSAIETVNEYLFVSRITGSDMMITLSNYIENDISYIDDTCLDKRIASRDGIYFTPEFEIDNDTLLILNADRISKNEEFKFLLPFVPDTLLISNLLDIIMLKDNHLYTSKLMLDYYNLNSPGSSVNNNSFIWVDDENSAVGESVRITINTELLQSQSLSRNIKISIKNRDVKQYLNQYGLLVEESDTWLSLLNTSNRISISINIENDDPYIFELKEDSRDSSFYAMVYQNKVSKILIDKDVDNIYFYNKKLNIQDTSGNTYTAEPIRLGFVSDDRYCYIQHKFEEIELIYED